MSNYSIAKVYEFYEANVRDAVSSVQWARKESRAKRTKADIRNLLIGFMAGILSGVCLMRIAL